MASTRTSLEFSYKCACQSLTWLLYTSFPSFAILGQARRAVVLVDRSSDESVMSVLAPPPSPTPSAFEAMLSDSDINIDRSMTVNHLKRKEPDARAQQTSSSDVENTLDQSSAKSANDKDGPPHNHQKTDVPSAKRLKTGDSLLVELKYGKLSLKQKTLNWALTMPVMKSIIEFQTFLALQEKLDSIPEDRLDVIARLAQESDKSLSELVKMIRNILMPEDLGSSDSETANSITSTKHKLTPTTVQQAILQVVERKNYGVDASWVASDSVSLSSDTTIPSSLQIWRWEVKHESMLPKENKEKALMRRRERQEAGKHARIWYDRLSISERQILLSKGNKNKSTAVTATKLLPAPPLLSKRSEGLSAIQPIEIDGEQDGGSEADTEKDNAVTSGPSTPSGLKKFKSSSATSTIQPKEAATLSSDLSPQDKRKRKEAAELSPEKMREREEKEAVKAERLRVKEAKKIEREARELERVKAKEAKEAEVRRAEDRKKRQANFLTSFVRKSATSSSPTKSAAVSAEMAQSPSKDAESTSDFDKTFLPCQYKDLAPINRFRRRSPLVSAELSLGQEHLSRQEMLADLRSRSLARASLLLPKQRLGVHPPVSVRDIKRIVTESDVLGGNAQERAEKALEILQDPHKVQMKLLQFESDRRPGWYGTWTKSTNLIGPRCPLGQDPVSLDYSYDSDAEWEESGQVEGEDVQDGEGDKDDSIVDSDDDSEMDDWLVDDLEVEEEEDAVAAASLPNTPQLDKGEMMDEIIEVDEHGQPVTSKTAQSTTETNILHPKKKKKVKLLGRRFETKLVPFSTGPHWESSFGDCAYEHFFGYRIEFLNDACFGLDPFTFTSTIETEPVSSVEPGMPSGECTPTKLAARKAALPAGGVLASLWANTVVEGETVASPSSAATNTSSQLQSGSAATSFKHQLMDDVLPHLLSGIDGSTKTRAGLVDDLKEHLTTLGKTASKSAIAERISIYAKKVKQDKKTGAAWTVKDEYRTLMTTSCTSSPPQ